ncbi:DUF1835 domain-containing protein [Paenibacillus sp. 2TAB23]|uniref:DUF1835 domain-containing protein n=1 Tax=Paenibacillus sp. 2TAB23 TaxID=3233004 RepID=UPI003F976520
MESICEQLKELNDYEARKLLSELLELSLSQLNHEDEGKAALAQHAADLCSSHIAAALSRRRAAEQRKTTVHLIFGLSAAGSFKVALSKLGRRMENEVIAFNEVFSTGPIHGLEHAEGQRYRDMWLADRIRNYTHYQLVNREHQVERITERLSAIPEHKSIDIWCADNAHDQIGLRFALHILKGKRNAIRVINVSRQNGLAAEQEKRLYTLGLLDLDAYMQAIEQSKFAAALSDDSRKQYEMDWLKLSDRKDTLRFWENGEVRAAAEEELDSMLLEAVKRLESQAINDGYVRAGAVIGDLQEHADQLIDFGFMEYRLWVLISAGTLSFRGLPVAMHQYEVRIKRRNKE